MEMQQVRYFLALCEEGNFTRAARRCGVAQPSITNAIRHLESGLGGPLFHRLRRGVTLTPLGARVWPHFLSIEQSVAAIKSEAAFVSSKAAMQPLWQKELAMSRNLLLSAVVLVPLIGIGGFVGTSMLTGPSRSEPAAAIAVDVHALHLAIDVSALPEKQIDEPF
jgi:molybdenum-dependent DNA-binding transcriptional regulator ModE